MERPAQKAGKALVWQAIQLGGDKVLFFIRILILARILTPEDFGLVAIATTSMGFLNSITNIGLIPALVQGQNITGRQFNSAWTVGILRASLISIVMFLGAPLIAMIFNEPQSTPINRVFALYPVLIAAGSIKITELNRNLSFRPLAILKLIDSVVKAVISIVLSFSFGVWGLVAGTLAGAAVTSALSYFFAPHRPKLIIDQESIRPLIMFGRWMFITSLIAIVGNSVLRIVITRQLGAAALGLYYLALQLASLPTEISSGVIGQVAFPMFSRLQTDLERLKRAFRTTVIGTTAILYPLCLLIIVLTPTFVAEVLGSKWNDTEALIQILSFATMIGIFGDTVVEILKGVGRPDKTTMMVFTQTLLLIVFVPLLTNRFGINGAALASIPAVFSSQIMGIIFIRQVMPQPFSGLNRPFSAILIASLAGAMVALIMDRIFEGIAGLIVAGLSAGLCTLVILWITNRKWSLGLIKDFVIIFPGAARFLQALNIN